MNIKYLGDTRILELKRSSWPDFKPVGCLQSNGFTEDVEMIGTTTEANGGWRTSEPTTQGYNIAFTGLQLITETGVDSDKTSYDELKIIKRARERIEWRMLYPDGTQIDSGEGYITSIGESAEAGQFLVFDCNIEGYGEPDIDSVAELPNGLLFSDDQQIQFSDGQDYITTI